MTQIPMGITAAKFYYVSHETFGNVSKFPITYFINELFPNISERTIFRYIS